MSCTHTKKINCAIHLQHPLMRFDIPSLLVLSRVSNFNVLRMQMRVIERGRHMENIKVKVERVF